MSAAHSTQVEIGGRKLTLETGRVAKQADGSVLVRYGDTVVLATVVASRSAVEGQDFFPLSVDYRERAYAGGRIPGGFFKREGRPAEKEILTSRLIDRPLRPLFPKGFRNEIQLIVLAISSDQENDPGILAMNGASAAVAVAGLPFLGPFGAVRIGLIDGRLVVNPPFADLERTALDLVVAATEDSVMMVEAGANEVPEDTLVEAIALGHQECRQLVRAQRALAQLAGKAAVGVRRRRAPGSRARGAGPRGHAGPDPGRHPDPGEGPPRAGADEARAGGPRRGRSRRVAQGQGPRAARQAREAGSPADGARGRRPHRRPQVHRDSGDQRRGVVPAPDSRLGALHPRRDAGAGRRHARDQAGRAAGRDPGRGDDQAVHAPLQLPVVQRGGDPPLRQPGPPGDRTRRARRALRRCPSCRRARASPTRSASSRTSWSPTAPRPWPRSAAPRWR